jgi:hypothetical protein
MALAVSETDLYASVRMHGDVWTGLLVGAGAALAQALVALLSTKGRVILREILRHPFRDVVITRVMTKKGDRFVTKTSKRSPASMRAHRHQR